MQLLFYKAFIKTDVLFLSKTRKSRIMQLMAYLPKIYKALNVSSDIRTSDFYFSLRSSNDTEIGRL